MEVRSFDQREREYDTYIYTPTGVYGVPAESVALDHKQAVRITPRQWREHRKHHRAMVAAHFLSRHALLFDTSIVVLERWLNDGSRVCHWFVRLAVDGGCSAFRMPFGQRFLWQVPHATCLRILSDINQFRLSYIRRGETPPWGNWSSLLLLPPTQNDFAVAQWPEFQHMHHVRDWYDRVFIMSVMPCRAPIADRGENARPPSVDYDRPAELQPGRRQRGSVDFHRVPCDVCNLVVARAVAKFVRGEAAGDWNAFLAVRAVCKSWRDNADALASQSIQSILKSVGHSLSSGNVDELLGSRDLVLNNSLMPLALIQDAVGPNHLNLMRLRAERAPRSLPLARGTAAGGAAGGAARDAVEGAKNKRVKRVQRAGAAGETPLNGLKRTLVGT